MKPKFLDPEFPIIARPETKPLGNSVEYDPSQTTSDEFVAYWPKNKDGIPKLQIADVHHLKRLVEIYSHLANKDIQNGAFPPPTGSYTEQLMREIENAEMQIPGPPLQ